MLPLLDGILSTAYDECSQTLKFQLQTILQILFENAELLILQPLCSAQSIVCSLSMCVHFMCVLVILYVMCVTVVLLSLLKLETVLSLQLL